MIRLLQEQYTLVTSTRLIVFDFLHKEVGKDIHTPVPAFAGKTIDETVRHVAYCYYNWLACFAMKRPYLQNPGISTDELYALVDDAVDAFLNQYKDQLEIPITGVHDSMGRLSVSPLALFTHVTTHEFHHKGQMMSMCRLLGYPPPDTDVSNAFESRPTLPVKVNGPMPDFRLFWIFLWGEGHSINSDGDSYNPASRKWTWLHMHSREIAGQFFEIEQLQADPSIYTVRAEDEQLAQKVAYFLASETNGKVHLDNQWRDPARLKSMITEHFDLVSATQRANSSVYRKSTLKNPYPNLS